MMHLLPVDPIAVVAAGHPEEQHAREEKPEVEEHDAGQVAGGGPRIERGELARTGGPEESSENRDDNQGFAEGRTGGGGHGRSIHPSP